MVRDERKLSVCVVIPAYQVSDHILSVISQIPSSVSRVIVVDDACPENSGKLVELECSDDRVEVLFNPKNMGVGGAMVAGYRLALQEDHDIIVKVDGDGQMDVSRLGALLGPIKRGVADYTKGSRFDSIEDLEKMPAIRIFGNAVLSIMSKFSTGYWKVVDPTNGFTAIHSSVLARIRLDRLRTGWFFESDMLFRLAIQRAVVYDVPMPAIYGNEVSNLRIGRAVMEFLYRHSVNFIKRIFYQYYLREWSVASLELPLGIGLWLTGLILGGVTWQSGIWVLEAGAATPTILAVTCLILGAQLLLAFLGADIASEPSRPTHPDLTHDNRLRD